MAFEMTSLERRTFGDILARAARAAERKLVARVAGSLSVFHRGVGWSEPDALYEAWATLGEPVLFVQQSTGDLPGQLRFLVSASTLWPFVRHLRGREARVYGGPTRLDHGAWREVATVLGSSVVASLVSSAGLVTATAPARPAGRLLRVPSETRGVVLATEFELARDDQGVVGYLSWHLDADAARTLREGCASHLAPVAAALEALGSS